MFVAVVVDVRVVTVVGGGGGDAVAAVVFVLTAVSVDVSADCKK